MLFSATENQQHIWTTAVRIFTVFTIPYVNSQ